MQTSLDIWRVINEHMTMMIAAPVMPPILFWDFGSYLLTYDELVD